MPGMGTIAVGLDAKILRTALNDFKSKYGHGAWAELARKTGLSAAAFSTIASGLHSPKLETWEALYSALPGDFPEPVFEGGKQYRRNKEGGQNAGIISAEQFVSVPVFRAGAGDPCNWTDEGFPLGQAGEYVMVPNEWADGNTFGVTIYGDSMSPHLNEGDVAIVVPSQALENGKLCFASWPEEDGQRLVKRYYNYGDAVILRSDNPSHSEIVLDADNGHGVRIFRVMATMRKE